MLGGYVLRSRELGKKKRLGKRERPGRAKAKKVRPESRSLACVSWRLGKKGGRRVGGGEVRGKQGKGLAESTRSADKANFMGPKPQKPVTSPGAYLARVLCQVEEGGRERLKEHSATSDEEFKFRRRWVCEIGVESRILKAPLKAEVTRRPMMGVIILFDS